jgi:hypothetical protein
METFGVKSLSEKYALYSIITKFKAIENTNDPRHLNGKQAKRTLDVVTSLLLTAVLPVGILPLPNILHVELGK